MRGSRSFPYRRKHGNRRNSPPAVPRLVHDASSWQDTRDDVAFRTVRSSQTLDMWYDGAIMMAKTQITLESEMQRRARQRANDLGVSLAEYFRRLVARDLARPETAAHVDRIFDLGTSGGSDIATQKHSMIAEAFQSKRKNPRHRR